MIFTGVIKLHNAVTYYSDEGSKQSWIDHVLCTGVIDNLVLSISVLNDVISSDHRPLLLEFNCNFATCIPEDIVLCEPSCVVNWNNLSDSVITKYQNVLDTLLKHIEVHNFKSNLYDMEHSKPAINQFHGKIMICLRTAALSIMDDKQISDLRNNVIVPGWNDLMKEKHSIARQAFHDWYLAGKSKYNPMFYEMHHSRVEFKRAFRYCKQHYEQIKADSCEQF